MNSLVENISDTARWVATFRADESERPDAVFKDPFARRLAGKKGEQIADSIEFSRKNSWSFVARTFLFDQFISNLVDEGYSMVINLAAGLDTRPYRMKLPQDLQWIDVDLPGILEYKQQMLKDEKPVCDLRTIALDLSERDKRHELFQSLATSKNKAAVVSEGLMIYLDAQQAGELSDDLSDHLSFQRWVFDLSSPMVLEMAQKEMGPFLKAGNALFKFAPEEGEAFFLTHGWKSLQSFSKLKTAATLNRLSEDLKAYAAMPEPEGPRRPFPWSGVCLFENVKHEFPDS